MQCGSKGRTSGAARKERASSCDAFGCALDNSVRLPTLGNQIAIKSNPHNWLHAELNGLTHRRLAAGPAIGVADIAQGTNPKKIILVRHLSRHCGSPLTTEWRRTKHCEITAQTDPSGVIRPSGIDVGGVAIIDPFFFAF